MSDNHYLLFVVHGSRLTQSNDEMNHMVENLNKLHLPYKKILIAFLELKEPSIPKSLEKAIGLGAERISLFPYFLTQGKHVSVDILNIVQMYTQKYPDIDFTLLDYFGKNSKIINFIEMILKNG